MGQLWEGIPHKQVDLMFRELDLSDLSAWRRTRGCRSTDTTRLSVFSDLPTGKLLAWQRSRYLATHGGYVSSRRGARPLTDYLRVFISHTHEHRERVGHLKVQLENRGVECFVAHADITPSDEWREVILLGLGRRCSCGSRRTSTAASGPIRRSATASRVADTRAEVRRAELYGFLEGFQALRGDGVPSHELPREVFRSFARQSATADRIAESLALAFRASPSS